LRGLYLIITYRVTTYINQCGSSGIAPICPQATALHQKPQSAQRTQRTITALCSLCPPWSIIRDCPGAPLERRIVAQPPALRTPSSRRRIRACSAPYGRRAWGGAIKADSAGGARRKRLEGLFSRVGAHSLCGRNPQSVLAKHYSDFSPEVLKDIYDKADLKYFG
jgi:hypothetical protein